MNMIRHDHHSMEANSVAVLAQAMSKDQIASGIWKACPPQRAEGNEQIAIGFLQMRKSPPVPVFRRWIAGHGLRRRAFLLCLID